NPKVLHTVGDAYEYIGDFESVVQCRSVAFRADNSFQNQTKLGVSLLHLNRPKEARPYLEHIISSKDKDNLPVLYLLVEAYQDKGLHKEALDVLRQMETMDPELQNDERHKETVQSSECRLDNGDDVPSSYLNTPRGIEPLQGGTPLWVPYALPIAILCFVVGSYLYSAFSKGMARDMVLLSGSPVAYTAMINDKTYQLQPYEFKHITLPEGELAIQIKGTKLPIPGLTVLCRSPFFSRPFESKIFVINPDGLGLLINESVAYTTYTTRNDDNSYKLYHSKVLHEFSDIDYPFKEFPKEIQMSSKASREYRTGLSSFHPESLSQLLQVLMNHLSREEMIRYLEKYVAIAPENSPLLWHLSDISSPERFLAFVKQGLGQGSVMVDWHRAYQSVMETYRPDYDLVGEYTSYHKAHPSDPYFTYLLGRVVPDYKSAESIYLQSESLGSPIGFGYHAAAYHCLCSGRYDKALDLAQKAVAVQSDYNQYFQSTLYVSLLAKRRYDSLLETVKKERILNDTDKLLATREIKLLMLKNQRKEAENVKSSYLDTLKRLAPEQDLSELNNDFEALIAYLSGNYKRYATAVEGSSDGLGPVYSALQKNDAAHAADLLNQLENSPYEIYLLTYCVAKVNGDKAVADQMLAKSIQLVSSGDSDRRLAAKMLNGDIHEIKSHLQDICIRPQEKRILALSLGLTFPSVKDHCFKMAKKLNFDRGFPHQTINNIVSKNM
ncbi:MAG: tetratricopeptide repeat protein, partial [Desulfobacteraceae bacterium]